MPRPKKTDVEIQAMREKILDVALAILDEDGPEAITSRAVAERMKVAHMSLFTYLGLSLMPVKKHEYVVGEVRPVNSRSKDHVWFDKVFFPIQLP